MANRTEIGQGVVDAENMNRGMSMLGFEVLFLSVLIGVHFSSWWLFGISLVVLMVLVFVRSISAVAMTIFSFGWGYIIFSIAHGIWGTGAGVVCGILALLITGGMHGWAYQYIHAAKATDGSVSA